MKRTLLALATTLAVLVSADIAAKDATAEAARIHEGALVLDTHLDTPANLRRPGWSIADDHRHEGELSQVDLPRMKAGGLDGGFWVIYTAKGARDEAGKRAARDHGLERLVSIREMLAAHASDMELALTAADAERIASADRRVSFISMENAAPLASDPSLLEVYHRLGLRMLGITHVRNNEFGDSSKDPAGAEWNGLSPLGKEAVKEMNRLGIMVDVSHTSEATFYDVMKESSVPVIASHSSVRALCDHPRNLTDDQIRAIAAKGGVVQICLYNEFINPEPAKASIDDALEHIRYVADLVGVDYVGIGSDFDGGGELLGCRSSNELIQITVKLLGLGYTEPEIEKIWGGNLLRVMNAVQQAAGVDQLSNN